MINHILYSTNSSIPIPDSVASKVGSYQLTHPLMISVPRRHSFSPLAASLRSLHGIPYPTLGGLILLRLPHHAVLQWGSAVQAESTTYLTYLYCRPEPTNHLGIVLNALKRATAGAGMYSKFFVRRLPRAQMLLCCAC